MLYIIMKLYNIKTLIYKQNKAYDQSNDSSYCN